MNAPRFGVAVVGGGPAGLACAISLLRLGLSVLVIERTHFRCLRVGEHLPPSAKRMFGSLGLGNFLHTGRHESCPGIRSLWGSSEPGEKRYVFDPYGEGVNLSRPEFDRELAAAAARLGATIETGTRVVGVQLRSDVWRMELVRGRHRLEVFADYLVDATGRVAALSKQLGARMMVYDDMVGIWMRGPPNSAPDALISIEALQDGWWYSAGLADGSLVATYLTDADLFD